VTQRGKQHNWCTYYIAVRPSVAPENSTNQRTSAFKLTQTYHRPTRRIGSINEVSQGNLRPKIGPPAHAAPGAALRASCAPISTSAQLHTQRGESHLVALQQSRQWFRACPESHLSRQLSAVARLTGSRCQQLRHVGGHQRGIIGGWYTCREVAGSDQASPGILAARDGG
jgi:hypothetical protein